MLRTLFESTDSVTLGQVKKYFELSNKRISDQDEYVYSLCLLDRAKLQIFLCELNDLVYKNVSEYIDNQC